jgi:hypothetical protein
MFRFRDSSQLELAFDRAVRDLRNHDITSEEYARKLDAVVKLHRMIMEDKSSHLSPDVMANVGANLLGLVMIIKHEQFGVITSRAFGWFMKPFTRF